MSRRLNADANVKVSALGSQPARKPASSARASAALREAERLFRLALRDYSDGLTEDENAAYLRDVEAWLAAKEASK